MDVGRNFMTSQTQMKETLEAPNSTGPTQVLRSLTSSHANTSRTLRFSMAVKVSTTKVMLFVSTLFVFTVACDHVGVDVYFSCYYHSLF